MTDDRLIVSTEPDELPAVLDEALPCPRCHAGPERRVLSAGFGKPHVICGKCGLSLEAVNNGGR